MKTSKIVAAFLMTASFSTAAFAASSATLLLQGVVGAINDITVTPIGTSNTTLNITLGETAKSVANAQETSNDLSGYKIYISSPTGGELRHSVDATKKTTYKISYAGGASTTPTVAGVSVKTVSALSLQTVATSTIAVDVAALPNAVAGTYSDTLTVSIVGN